MTEELLKPGLYWAKYENEIEIVQVDIHQDDEGLNRPDINFAYRMGEFDTVDMDEITIIAPLLSLEEQKRLQGIEERARKLLDGIKEPLMLPQRKDMAKGDLFDRITVKWQLEKILGERSPEEIMGEYADNTILLCSRCLKAKAKHTHKVRVGLEETCCGRCCK